MSQKASRTRLVVHGFSVVVKHRMCAQLAALYCLEEILIGLCMGRRQELNNSNKKYNMKKRQPEHTRFNFEFFETAPIFCCINSKAILSSNQSRDFFFLYCNLVPAPQSLTETHKKKTCFAIRVIFFICIYFVLFYLFIYSLLHCSNSALKLI